MWILIGKVGEEEERRKEEREEERGMKGMGEGRGEEREMTCAAAVSGLK